jgi:hypothetical protein
VTASTTATVPRPPARKSAPPAAGPMSRARLLFSEFIAFACTSSSFGTRRGRNAFSAGLANVKRVAETSITG